MTDKQLDALRLADALEETKWQFPAAVLHEQSAAELRRLSDVERALEIQGKALRRLHEENRKLKTVMVAAAEEISAHWDAHCDSEGYGPSNLMRRLEEGIPSEYGYTAGAFNQLLEQNTAVDAACARLERINAQLLEALEAVMSFVDNDWDVIPKCADKARAAIAAAKESHA